jgi:hypothetical protein
VAEPDLQGLLDSNPIIAGFAQIAANPGYVNRSAAARHWLQFRLLGLAVYRRDAASKR